MDPESVDISLLRLENSKIITHYSLEIVGLIKLFRKKTEVYLCVKKHSTFAFDLSCINGALIEDFDLLWRYV